tara:strand:- start:8493 stop:8864 length:372 start_codon:yes stop_codon:yes gene_type:complete
MMGVMITGAPRPADAVIKDIKAGIAIALANQAQAVETAIKDQWVGWVHPTGGSREAWKATPVEVGPDSLSVAVENPVAYVPFVHRTGVKTTEVDTIVTDTLPPLLPPLLDALAAVPVAVPLTE